MEWVLIALCFVFPAMFAAAMFKRPAYRLKFDDVEIECDSLKDAEHLLDRVKQVKTK